MIALRKTPWNERNGRFSPLKAVVFALLFAPAAYILYELQTGMLDPKPVTEMIHRTGEWAIRFILISLAVTPFRKLAHWPKLLVLRRMLGVAAFAYAFAHLCLYVVDQKYDLLHVASEIVLRFYLTIGFVALLGLAALTATSTDAMIRRLGAQNWGRLHKTIYVIAALGLFHYYLQSKADVSDPVLLTGLFLILMLYRLFVKRAPLWEAATAAVVFGAGLDALLEAVWYALRRHYSFWDVLGANVDPDMFPRPAFWVAVAGVATLAVYAFLEIRSRRSVFAAAE